MKQVDCTNTSVLAFLFPFGIWLHLTCILAVSHKYHLPEVFSWLFDGYGSK